MMWALRESTAAPVIQYYALAESPGDVRTWLARVAGDDDSVTTVVTTLAV